MKQKISTKIILITIVIIVVIGGFFVWFKNNKSQEVQFATSIGVEDARYAKVELEQVKIYSQKSASDMIITSGTVVGLDLDQSSLLIDDGKENYVLVNFAMAFRSTFLPIFSNLKIGDVVEIGGSPMFTKGELVDGVNGKLIKSIGVDISQAKTFGMVSLTGISKISSQPDVLSWKKYTNKEYGIDFKYPLQLGQISELKYDTVLGSGNDITKY
ncbi:hypothetical protein KBD68_04275, partial [Candidatus Woesebacteria bacterium]|nr:hypothetical protein [Candidatus Woesebacteria bacterium]